MPDQHPPTLEDLARAVWIAWGRLGPRRHGVEWSALCRAMADLGERLDAAAARPPRPRASDYVLPVRLRVEKDFACALLSGNDPWPQNDCEAQAVIDAARRLARLLLDAPQPTPEAVRRDDQIRAVVADLRGHRDTCRVYDCTFTDPIPYEHRAAASAELAKGFGLWWDSWIEPKLKKIDEMLTPA